MLKKKLLFILYSITVFNSFILGANFPSPSPTGVVTPQPFFAPVDIAPAEVAASDRRISLFSVIAIAAGFVMVKNLPKLPSVSVKQESSFLVVAGQTSGFDSMQRVSEIVPIKSLGWFNNDLTQGECGWDGKARKYPQYSSYPTQAKVSTKPQAALSRPKNTTPMPKPRPKPRIGVISMPCKTMWHR